MAMLSAPACAAAQSLPAPASASTHDTTLALRPWVIGTSFGVGGASGGYGDFLETPINYDLNLGYQHGPWRFGGGLTFGSMAMKAPYQDEKEWAHHDIYLFATRTFRQTSRVRPYVQGRVMHVRIDPRSELFYTVPFDSASPEALRTKPSNGQGFTLQPGVEISLAPSLSRDVGAFYSFYHTSAFDLSPINRPSVSDGQEYGVRVGLTWRPVSGYKKGLEQVALDSAGNPLPLPLADSHRDAWGVPRSWGWGIGEMLGINYVASAYNEQFRGVYFSQISPRSFWYNLKQGFYYDDNEFKNNQFIHPFNGSTYYNAARANGLSFWPSAAVGFTGAFIWECCGETHLMSSNDLIATGIGGIAFGEGAYRVSSLVLDNRTRGWNRFIREFAGTFADPIRGFNRIVSGDAWKVQGNPSDPYDRRAPHVALQLLAGARMQGEGSTLFSDSLHYYGFAELNLDFGSTITNERRKPFDHFDFSLQWNYGDKQRLGHLLIRGDLFSKPLGGDPRTAKHGIALTQDFDFVENAAFQFATQSIGGSFTSQFRPAQKLSLHTRVEGSLILLGAVNSEYAGHADVPNAARLREYDYGPGAGATFEAWLRRNDRPLLYAFYRFAYLNVANGSVYNSNNGGEGSSANHFLQAATLRLTVPVRPTWGVGADASVFIRDSHFTAEGFNDIRQRNPELRLYLAFDFMD